MNPEPKVLVMRMNHVNLAVTDVAASRAFLETYFGLRCLAEPMPERLAVLTDEDGCVVALSNFNKADAVAYPKSFHIGFLQPSREAVDEVHARLERDGFDIGRRKEFHGAWTFYFEAPGGFTIEVGHQYEGPLPS